MKLKDIWLKVKGWKIYAIVITFLTSIAVGTKLFLKGKDTYDQFNKQVRDIEKNNERLVTESNNYRDKRVLFYKRSKKRKFR